MAFVAIDLVTFKLACIIYTVIIAPTSSLCNECSEECSDSSMDGNLNGTYNNDSDSVSPVVIAESYCFMNECTIMLEESNVHLNIVNNTGGRIIATNSTILFTIITNDSDVRNCSASDSTETGSKRPSVWLYGPPPLTLNLLVIIAAVANISIHFVYKELRTASGIIITILCIVMSTIQCVTITYVATYYAQVNIPKEICAVIYNYFNVVILANIYEATKTALLAHFAYAMFRSYKLLGDQENEKSLLYKYIAFIIGAPAIVSIIIITVDVTVTRKAVETRDGLCVLFIDNSATEGVQVSLAVYFVIIIIWLISQLLLLTIGLVLYFLITKQCCRTPRDLRVAIILIATVDVTIFIAVFLPVIQVSDVTRVLIITITFVTAIKQVTLFILFISSSKVTFCFMKNIIQT